MKQPGLHVIYAAAVRDAAGVNARPGAVVVLNGRVSGVCEPAAISEDLLAHAAVHDRREHLLLPAMVNAHTHLELTEIGPCPYDPTAGFVGWVNMLTAHRPQASREGEESEEDWSTQAATQGLDQSQRAGIQAIVDISRFASVSDLLRDSPLDGTTFLEMFGLGTPFDQDGLERIAHAEGKALQPHAPYSAGPALFDGAARSGRPVSCHLAETLDEQQFVSRLAGPFFDFIRSIGKWDDAFIGSYGRGLSPVQWMQPYLQAAANDGGWLAAHCNYVSDDDIAILADTNTSVAYCPLASEYFGHTGHRYREMLDAGVNVCLGTDSIVCADPNDPQPLGLLSAMRRLYRRDGTQPGTLLAMATTHGAKALRLHPRKTTLAERAPAKFVCIKIDPADATEPLEQALKSDAPAEMIDLNTLDEDWLKGMCDDGQLS